MPTSDAARAFVRDALEKLGIRHFVLGVHASAFPPAELDAGYGAPLSRGGDRLLAFASSLGFDALQLGPAGQVSTINLSPYDGTVFARNTWSLGLSALAGDDYARLLDPETIGQLGLERITHMNVQAESAERSIRQVLAACHARFSQLQTREPGHRLVRDFAAFRVEQAEWLELNALYDVMATRVVDDPTRFEPALRALFEPGPVGVQRRSAMRATLAAALSQSELAQYLCHAQHAEFRARAHALGLRVWGDMQVGFSHRDRFLHRECFAHGWRLGAPPSRTNPHGQPWGYPVLDPDQLETPDSPARRLFELRVRKLFAEYDGVRIDHPHGLVCPWVYSASDPDPDHAVRHGARAFDAPDHAQPDLKRWAIARHADLDPAPHSPFTDGLVRQLDEAQLARYARLMDVVTGLCKAPARDVLAVEVLSTCPYPLRRVLERHGLGRFRVTQKADPNNTQDPYRTEHAQSADWLMLGTHDTPPVLPLVQRWREDGSAHAKATYLAQRLIDDPNERVAAATLFAQSDRNLLCASLAELFSSNAQQVYIFIGDLFGEREPFNRAGVAHPDNWTARLPHDFEQVYSARVREGIALDIVTALELALTRKQSVLLL